MANVPELGNILAAIIGWCLGKVTSQQLAKLWEAKIGQRLAMYITMIEPIPSRHATFMHIFGFLAIYIGQWLLGVALLPGLLYTCCYWGNNLLRAMLHVINYFLNNDMYNNKPGRKSTRNKITHRNSGDMARITLLLQRNYPVI